jgi:translocation protein SEC63
MFQGAGKKAATTSNFVKVPSSPQSGETAAAVTAKQTEDGVEASPKTTKSLARKEKPKKPEPSEKSGGSDSEGADDSESDSASSGTAEDESGKANNDELSSNNENANILGGGGGEDEDMEDWNDADLGKRETLLESEPTDNYEVHCPFFPGEKFEWWYIYLVERKSRRLVSSVVPCKTLKHEKTVYF